MNKTESAYAEVLFGCKARGEIQDYKFESVKLRIGPNGARCDYTPDFMVWSNDGHIEFHEVKGRKSGGGYWAEDDAKVKIKAAAELYPFKFIIVWPRLKSEGGGWERAEI
jgi:hypothetical protein